MSSTVQWRLISVREMSRVARSAMAGTVTSSGGGAAGLTGLARGEPMRVSGPGTGMLRMVSRPERQVSTFHATICSHAQPSASSMLWRTVNWTAWLGRSTNHSQSTAKCIWMSSESRTTQQKHSSEHRRTARTDSVRLHVAQVSASVPSSSAAVRTGKATQ